MIKTLIISLPMFVCTFWSIVLLIDWFEQRTRAKARMLTFMVVAATLYACHFVFFNHLYGWMLVTDTIYCMTNLSVFPLYYLYINEVTEGQNQKHWQMTQLIPALLSGSTIGTLYTLMDPQEAQSFISTFLYQGSTEGLDSLARAQAITHICVRIIFVFQIPLILMKGIQKIKRYDKMVETNYADTDFRKMQMTKVILVMFIVTCLISFTANIFGKEYFDTAPWLVAIPSATFSTLLFLLGYAGHKQDFTINRLIMETACDVTPSAYTETSPAQDQEKAGANEIAGWAAHSKDVLTSKEERRESIRKTRMDIAETIKTERLYLQQDLKINDIAKLLHTNRDYIYQAINVSLGMSFSEFINRLRVEYATQLMKDNPEMSTNEVAFRSGFSSLASFYRNFKTYQNCPPQTYRSVTSPQDKLKDLTPIDK